VAEVDLKFENMKFKKSFVFLLLIILYVEKGCLAQGKFISEILKM
jgi:hypothetical protein